MVVDIWKTQPGLHIRTVFYPSRILIWPDPDTGRSPLEHWNGDITEINDHDPKPDIGLDKIMYAPCSSCRMERLSVTLYSGKSVSTVLKPSSLPGIDYIVEVAIDPEGGLR